MLKDFTFQFWSDLCQFAFGPWVRSYSLIWKSLWTCLKVMFKMILYLLISNVCLIKAKLSTFHWWEDWKINLRVFPSSISKENLKSNQTYKKLPNGLQLSILTYTVNLKINFINNSASKKDAFINWSSSNLYKLFILEEWH